MPDRISNDKNKRYYFKWLGFGIEFGGVVAVFCYMGYQLDAALDTSPYFLLTGFFLSFIGMLYLVFKQTRDMWRK